MRRNAQVRNGTESPPVPQPLYTRPTRRQLADIQVREAATAAAAAELALRRELAAFEEEQADAARPERTAGEGRHARPDPEAPAGTPGWTRAKVLWALLIGGVFSAIIALMALAAIGFQTAFLASVLPADFQKISIFFLPWDIELPKMAPVAFELTSSALALTTVALVLQQLPYGRWHRLMWGISLFVAVTNGWHIWNATDSFSLGVAYGAFSVIGPGMIHYLVLFLALLRSGQPVRQALTDAGGQLWRQLRLLVRLVVDALLSVVMHPRISAMTLWIKYGHRQLTFAQAHWIANRTFRARLYTMITEPLKDRAHTGVREGVRGDEEGVQDDPNGPDGGAPNTVPEVVPAGVHPGVQPAELERAHSGVPAGDAAVHGGVQRGAEDPGRAAILNLLGTPGQVPAELAHTLTAAPTHTARTLATEPGATVTTQPAATVNGTVVAGQSGAQTESAGAVDLVDEPVHTVRTELSEGVQPTVPAQRDHRGSDGVHPEPEGELTLTDRVILEFWEQRDDGVNVRAVNKSAIARKLFKDDAQSRRTTVTRVWDACVRGAHPDPRKPAHTRAHGAMHTSPAEAHTAVHGGAHTVRSDRAHTSSGGEEAAA